MSGTCLQALKYQNPVAGVSLHSHCPLAGVRGRPEAETVTQPLSQRADSHNSRKLRLPGVVKQLHSPNGKELAP